MFRILHLSDIHIGKTYKDPENIACQIASDIDYVGLSNINCIIVTGDIFDGQIDVSDSLIDAAVNFFEVLLLEINSNQNKEQISKDDVIFVPGNHDLIREDNIDERWSKYHDFLEKFYGTIPSFYNKDYSLFKEYKDYKIAFVGFNSCEIEKRNMFDEKYISKFEKYIDENKLNECGIDKTKVIEILKSVVATEYDDYGYIPMSQITHIERKVKGLDNYNIIALFHHHFYLFPEVAQQFGDSSLIRNYTQIIQHLRYMNVSVVLHGHKHFALERPFIMDDYYESSDNIIYVFAGGSVGTDRKEEHTFGVLDLYEKKNDIKLKHNKFVYNGEILEPIIKKQVPPQKLSGRVVKLLEILKTLNQEKYELYEQTAEKSFKSYDNCNRIISWVSEVITGFTEVYNYLDKDYNNILFLLYAINFRTISYMKIVGKEKSYYESASKSWDSFYETSLKTTDFMISKSDYHKLFMFKKLKDATAYCDKLLNGCDNKKTQIYLAFTMLGMFFSDLYLVLTKYADDFKESIKYKVNIKIEENKFHENVPAPRIVVRSDADRRSAYIDLLCNEATAHKMAVLFIKEFDLLINKFEDYFKIIGLKLYYLLPKIDKDGMKNTLDNYNFEAYIPTLIPLLTGDNIYSSKVVFARELIQNSIDAISVREAKEEREFSNEILIELNIDENGRRYFKITDSGTGMDRYKIERYFTSIGRSFYSGEEYEDLNISYKPISNFGIGFLSSFMVCQEIDVKTKYYLDNSEGLKLHIPNYDGCFFIELESDAYVGTEIKLYLNSSIDDKSIVDYIQKVMQDIKYTINIRYLEEQKEKQFIIPAHCVRRQDECEGFRFFVPFFENGDVGSLDYLNDILSNQYVNSYEYGLLIRNKKDLKDNNKCLVLNSGIVIEQASLESVFSKNFRRYNTYEREEIYNDIIINFPSNWLQLDVARENITCFSNVINEKNSRKGRHALGVKIANSLYKQILQYIEHSEQTKTKIPAICLQDVIQYAIVFCENQKSEVELREKLLELKYRLSIKFFDEGISYRLIRGGVQDEKVEIIYSGIDAKRKRKEWIDRVHTKDIQIDRFWRRQIENEEFIKRGNVYGRRFEHLLREMQSALNVDGNDKNIFGFLSIVLLNIPDEIICNSNMNALEKIFLKYFYVGSENTQEVRITYDELLNILKIQEK